MNRGHAKTISILTALLVIMVTMVSCVSTQSQIKSEEDCDYVLHRVLEQTQPQTISEMFLYLNSGAETFIPERLSFLIDSRNSIPGMDLLLTRWATNSLEYAIASYDSFSSFTTELTSALVFEDPVNMIEGSDSSISELYAKLYQDMIKDTVRAGLENINLSVWRQIQILYKAWVATNEKLYGTTGPSLEDEDIRDLTAELFVKLYFRFFSNAETIIRTTPDPDMEWIQAYVLGLD